MRPDFPRGCRICRRGEYDRAFREGRSRHTAHFRVIVARATGEQSRLGLVVSRKVGKAHARNQVKRRLREYFRLTRHRFRGAVEVVVVAKPGAAALDGRAICQELDAVLEPWRVPLQPEP